MPRVREIELFLNEETLKDLIISHLHRIGVIRDYEEVCNLNYGHLKDGCRQLTVRFEPDTQVIFHE